MEKESFLLDSYGKTVRMEIESQKREIQMLFGARDRPFSESKFRSRNRRWETSLMTTEELKANLKQLEDTTSESPYCTKCYKEFMGVILDELIKRERREKGDPE
jgi:hypothetical protein